MTSGVYTTLSSFTGRVCLSDTYLGRQWLLSQQHANTFRRLYWSVRKHRARSCRSFILSKSRSSNWKPLQKANQTIKAFVTHPALRSIWREAACNPRLIWKQQLSYSQNVVVLAPSILMRRPYNTLHLFVRSQGGQNFRHLQAVTVTTNKPRQRSASWKMRMPEYLPCCLLASQ
jgi:hypothetical protein